MNEYHQPLLPGQTYHLFSRAVGSEKLFRNTDNYRFFLQRLRQHTSGIAQYYCYSLLPNHFHLLVKIRDESRIIMQFKHVKKIPFDALQHNLAEFIMRRFSNFLNSYARSFNNAHHRKGTLFMDYLKRSKVRNDDDFTTFLWYIHKNAVHHQLTKTIGEWPFDSYKSLLSDEPTSLLRKEVIDWFGSKEAFRSFHQQQVYLKIGITDIDI